MIQTSRMFMYFSHPEGKIREGIEHSCDIAQAYNRFTRKENYENRCMVVADTLAHIWCLGWSMPGMKSYPSAVGCANRINLTPPGGS